MDWSVCDFFFCRPTKPARPPGCCCCWNTCPIAHSCAVFFPSRFPLAAPPYHIQIHIVVLNSKIKNIFCHSGAHFVAATIFFVLWKCHLFYCWRRNRLDAFIHIYTSVWVMFWQENKHHINYGNGWTLW